MKQLDSAAALDLPCGLPMQWALRVVWVRWGPVGSGGGGSVGAVTLQQPRVAAL